MTIDERADDAALRWVNENNVPIISDGVKYRALVSAFSTAMLEVARDQQRVMVRTAKQARDELGIGQQPGAFYVITALEKEVNATIS